MQPAVFIEPRILLTLSDLQWLSFTAFFQLPRYENIGCE